MKSFETQTEGTCILMTIFNRLFAEDLIPTSIKDSLFGNQNEPPTFTRLEVFIVSKSNPSNGLAGTICKRMDYSSGQKLFTVLCENKMNDNRLRYCSIVACHMHRNISLISLYRILYSTILYI